MGIKTKTACALLLATTLAACATPPTAVSSCSVQSRPFGTLSSGEAVTAYTVRNERIEATILDYGGIIHAIKVPDREGKVRNVVRNLEKLSDYESNATFSKIIGRFAGRINNGGFTLDGKRYDLVTRPDGLTVHGGPGGFGSRLWTSSAAECGVDLSLTSPDGENGFPGNLQVKAEFRIVDSDLRIDYTATTDKPTVINLTHHAFFNLSDARDVYGHVLQVNADKWLPTDTKRVPTGQIAPVAGAMDLRTGRNLGSIANSSEEVIKTNNGLDHTFVLNGKYAATLTDPASGRVLEVLTSEPGLVVFSANGWNGSMRDGEGRPLQKGGGLALETQHFPNSPNVPAFPTTVIRPQWPLYSATTFRFLTDRR
ncbi:aldose epimerase family protein [Massilia sp. IC2-476]|uniref:aldose epimerase family protein n=1 Tax=Massilia sp. IC2-476 TaxID=2887199 RepID=UPI001D12C93A|nr:aldose epimerase family protein [Massilia sp. IC2-476]MCC2974192.1 galactose mutarotase [Massilia sp. IC2-476]